MYLGVKDLARRLLQVVVVLSPSISIVCTSWIQCRHEGPDSCGLMLRGMVGGSQGFYLIVNAITVDKQEN